MWPNGSCQSLSHLKTAFKPARRFSRLCGEKLQRRQKIIPADTTKYRQKKRSSVGNLVQRKGLLLASSEGGNRAESQGYVCLGALNFESNT